MPAHFTTLPLPLQGGLRLIVKAPLETFCFPLKCLYLCAATSPGQDLFPISPFAHISVLHWAQAYICLIFYTPMSRKKKTAAAVSGFTLKAWLYVSFNFQHVVDVLSLCQAGSSGLCQALPDANGSLENCIDFWRCFFILYFSPTTCSLLDKANINEWDLQKPHESRGEFTMIA